MNDVMFSDEQLSIAAGKVRRSMLASLPTPEDCATDFSAEFLRKMQKLVIRQRHKATANQFVRRAAILILSALIGLGGWLTVDVQAREAFFGWLRELGQNSIIYRPVEKNPSDAAKIRYHLPVIPEGYSLYWSDQDEFGGYFIYQNDGGKGLKFDYLYESNSSALLAGMLNAKISKTVVNGVTADLLVSSDPSIASAVVWTTDDNTVFFLSAFLDKGDLIALAESVCPTK